MTDVRIVDSAPVVSDFTDRNNSPIVIDNSTDIAYYLNGSTITILKALTGICYGSFYQHDIPTTVTISVTGTYYQITGNTAGQLEDMTFSSDALTVNQTGIYIAAISCSYDDSGNTTFDIGLFIDGVKSTPISAHASTTGSLVSNAATMGLISLTAGEVIDLRIANDTNTNDVNIGHCSLMIVRIA